MTNWWRGQGCPVSSPLPAIGSPTMCLLSDLPQCATFLGHNRSSQVLWQSVIVIATSCHNSSNLVGIFYDICSGLYISFTNMEKPHNRRLKRNAECQILFVEDLDADLHLRCTNYLYFPVKGEKCLFDGRPRRANRRWPHHLLTLCNSFSCHHQTIFLHHHKSEKCTISILNLFLNYFGLPVFKFLKTRRILRLNILLMGSIKKISLYLTEMFWLYRKLTGWRPRTFKQKQ